MNREESRNRVDIIVPCASGKHRVRLKPGRFLSSARCSKCGSQVDPTRVRRMLAFLAASYRAHGATPMRRLGFWGVWVYLVFVLLTWFGLWAGGDRWGPMTVLLFGPRWILLLPLVVLGVFAVPSKPRLSVPLLIAAMIVLVPIMGFNIGWGRWTGAETNGMPLRVVTYNAAGGRTLNTSLPWIIEKTRADIIGFQECGSALASAVRELPEIAWHTSIRDQLCLVSRFPLIGLRQLDRENIRFAGGSGMVIEHTIDLGERELHLTNLHLDTPRKGLAPVREGHVSEGLSTLGSKSVVRDIESRQAREMVDAGGDAIIVLGGFNLPVESVIYRRHWRDLTNAFSHSGFGFGYTRFAGWIRARIDHILVGPKLQVERTIVGPDFGSDHRPVIADLLLPYSR